MVQAVLVGAANGQAQTAEQLSVRVYAVGGLRQRCVYREMGAVLLHVLGTGTHLAVVRAPDDLRLVAASLANDAAQCLNDPVSLGVARPHTRTLSTRVECRPWWAMTSSGFYADDAPAPLEQLAVEQAPILIIQLTRTVAQRPDRALLYRCQTSCSMRSKMSESVSCCHRGKSSQSAT